MAPRKRQVIISTCLDVSRWREEVIVTIDEGRIECRILDSRMRPVMSSGLDRGLYTYFTSDLKLIIHDIGLSSESTAHLAPEYNEFSYWRMNKSLTTFQPLTTLIPAISVILPTCTNLIKKTALYQIASEPSLASLYGLQTLWSKSIIVILS